MKFLARLHRHLPWLNLPVAALVALLQRTPVLRVVATAGETVIASPVGQVIRSAVAAAASLGAMHALAGATTLSVSSGSTTGITVTAGTSAGPIAMGTIGTQTQPLSWQITGTIPSGLRFQSSSGTSLTTAGTLNTPNGVMLLSGTPTANPGSYPLTLIAYEFANRTGIASPPLAYTITVLAGTPVAPSFSLSPASQTVTASANVTFTSTASGTPTPTYQWRKDGAALNAATSVSLTLTNVQLSSAGTYTVVASNSAGSTTSGSATLTVNPPATAAPAFTTQPASLTVATGSTAVLNATATAATSYRWQRNGTDLPAATAANLVLINASAADAAAYRVIATNSIGSTTSATATLAVNTVAPTDATRLVNLSILTTAGPGAKVLTVGAVVGPLNFSGALPLVVRAVGPTLNTAFGITGVLADPTLTLNASGVTAPIATNDNWGGGAALRAAFTAVGAFDLPAASLDSAVLPNATVGGYTVQVTGKNETSGLVIAEIYDASTARTATSPRLINLSTLTQIDAGTSLAVGFVLRGATARTVLIRGVGPSLGTIFGLGGVMPDPKLELFSNDTGAKINENDNWGGDAQLMDAAASVGAFALADAATKDAVLLVTLAPGAYSARVSGVAGSAGTAIVEVYELP